MPTYNRREFVPHAIRYFLRQDYPHKELIILDDGTDAVADLVPDVPNIRYIRLANKVTLGAKLNLACSHAAGSILALWDDDDWYASRRLSYQVSTLQTEKTDVCGINKLLYYDLINHRAFQYRYPANQRTWISSLCFTKDLWQQNPFADINVGMDGLFIWATAPERISVLPDWTISVHMIHNQNVSPKRTAGQWWQPHAVADIQTILQADWQSYRPAEAVVVAPPPSQITVREGSPVPTVPKPVRNVYACLVHEHAECVLDLVRNLRHLDPESPIVLYNGGQNPDLLKSRAHWDALGVLVHPKPHPMQHGYLHQFALDTMAFALDTSPFDTLTIVDSDQLAIRAGYPAFLASFLASQTNIGLLSNRPERLTQATQDIWPVTQAFKEYDLWKPWLRRFADGESKFVHWTFWPSTIFTADAARDLTRLFREDPQLQHLMIQTKIWATEEIILPTLVRLLGYEIARNPCSHTYVQYRQAYSQQQLQQAFTQPDAYWVHPVERHYEDTVRQHTRRHFNHYTCEKPADCFDTQAAPSLFRPLALIRHLKTMEGWLSDEEADLLLAITLKVCQGASAPPVVVEVGSYHGKSTVLIGSVIKAFCPQARLIAIDLHDGKLGAADQELQVLPPSLIPFKMNLVKAGVADVVQVIQKRADEVPWQTPIALLFIDGLHDYPNVARDFWHFADYLQPNAYVAFHDYADYYPGVQGFVRELIASKAYRKIQVAETLVVLQKV
ncbi:glycosyltransferase [Hymenobacter bucti]|uniref:Glycosyltransferase n=1 Tax=Hymenobacter bucti TaxID=1844114 RepID=A0ABW4R1H5_9BACT